MSKLEEFIKQPYEEFTISTDFSANFLDDETITSQTVSAIDSKGVDATSAVTNQASVTNDGNSKVQVLVRAGDRLNSPYKITFRCVTSIGHKWEHDIKMKVVEL